MNILFLTTHLNEGGITSYLLTMSKGIIRRGYQVHIASSGGNMEDEFLSLGVKLLKLNIRTKSELDPRLYLSLPKVSRYVHKNKIDLIHAQTRITQVMGRALQKITGKPFISTCHGFFKTRLSRKLFPCWGDVVIAISPAVRDHLAYDFKIDKGKISLIESGIDFEKFTLIDAEEKKKQRAQFNLGNETVIGLVARLSDVKGQDVLIDAMSKVIQETPDTRLLFVGEGRMEAILRDKVQTLNLGDYVNFLPFVNKTNEMLALFDIFVMPSRQEGLGLSIMEAQAVGLPVIASRVGGIPSLIKNGETGILVETENPDELAQAIISLIKDKTRRQEMAAAGREFIVNNFSAEKMIDKVIPLYQKLSSKDS